MSLDAFFQLAASFNLHTDAVFLITFILLSFRRLHDTVTVSSTLLIALIAAACSQLAPLIPPLLSQSPMHASEPTPPPFPPTPPHSHDSPSSRSAASDLVDAATQFFGGST